MFSLLLGNGMALLSWYPDHLSEFSSAFFTVLNLTLTIIILPISANVFIIYLTGNIVIWLSTSVFCSYIFSPSLLLLFFFFSLLLLREKFSSSFLWKASYGLYIKYQSSKQLAYFQLKGEKLSYSCHF